jgi:Domain of unknown function (DUF4124)
VNLEENAPMKRLVVAALALAVVPLASADLYKYIDKNGKTVYSDTPPTDVDAKRLSGPPPAATAAGKTYVERDKEAQKGQEKAAEEAKKAAEKDKAAQQKKERCEQAKGNLQIYIDGGRILKNNDKGEREYMSDEEIEAERAKMQKIVDEACGK